MDKTITVFTPTYNRCSCLERCFQSINSQTCKDFVWLIIDDGSTDNTQERVSEWICQNNEVDIIYLKKENGGLHTGYNAAIEMINTELCVCIDSDDWLPEDAIERIIRIWKSIKEQDYIGIIGLDHFADGRCVGDKFPEGVEEMYLYEKLLKYKISGDKKMVYRTEILKKVAPMPVFKGEKNFNPSFMMYKADEFGKLYAVNQCFCIVEYQDDGMSNSMLYQYYNSPRSFAEIRKLYMMFPGARFPFLFRQHIHYISSCALAGKLSYAIKESPQKAYSVIAFPFGILLSIYIKRKNMVKV